MTDVTINSYRSHVACSLPLQGVCIMDFGPMHMYVHVYTIHVHVYTCIYAQQYTHIYMYACLIPTNTYVPGNLLQEKILPLFATSSQLKR